MSDAVSWALTHLPRQAGRTAVVTGANSGIGLEASRALAALGARVVTACRSLDKAREAEHDIKSTVPGASLEILHLDLADLSSVAAFAGAFASGGDGDSTSGPAPAPLRPGQAGGAARGLDLLINNAGVMALPARRETADGFEMQFGTNVLGHFALTARLLPHVLAAPRRAGEPPEARVVWLSSLAHQSGRLDLDDLQSEHAYDPWTAYRQSKLADLVLALEMQRRLTDSGADAISLAAHPGLSSTNLATDMMRGSPVRAALVGPLMRLIAMPAWKGALPTLVAAASPTVRPADYVGPDGFREIRGTPTRAAIAPQAKDEETARRLWRACETLTGVEMLS